MKKRLAILLAVLVVAAPFVAVVSVPELRERVRSRWHVHKLRSEDPETRRLMVATLVAKGPAEIDDVLPEVVAAAVVDVSSRSIFVGSRDAPKPGQKTVMLVVRAHHTSEVELAVERAFTALPDEVELPVEKMLFQSPLFRLGQGRTLFVTADDRLEMAVPLVGELGERILATVEERLRAR
ncbi:MAG: hypothetical protein ACAI25_00180 [Planctomycetota bacterium]